jgi:hypothetical protein
MKFLLFFSMLLGGVASHSFAQKTANRAEIQGVVLDSVSNKPLRTASVSLLSVRDSSYVMASVTDGDGRFRLRNVAEGRYRLLVTFVGYQSAVRYVTISRDTPVANMGTLLMTEQTNTLNEVVIRQERAPITIRQDTLEFNASSFKTQPNAQVEELLRKLPGVEVARDGSIRAQGQAVNRVLVDGKPFFGNDPKMATRNLPADIVDNVQLYDQSSDQSQFSGVDDGNRERTINLTLKKDKSKGYFGRNLVGAGTERYQGNLSLNRFTNRKAGAGRQFSLIGQANNLNQQNFTLSDGVGAGQGGMNGGPAFVGGPGGAASGGNQTPTNIIETRAIGANYRTEMLRPKWGRRVDLSSSYFVNQAITTTDQQSRRQSVLPGDNTPDRAFLTDQSNYSQNNQTNHRFNARLDWQLDSLTTLRFTPNVSWQTTRYNSRTTSRSMLSAQSVGGVGEPSPNAQLLNEGQTRYGSSGSGLNGYNNLLLMRKFRREGRTFSANLNTILTDGTSNALNQSANTFYDSTGVTPDTTTRLDQRNAQTSHSLQNALTLSYTEPLSLTQKVEVTYVYLNSLNRAERSVLDSNAVTGLYDRPNALLSNRFSSLFTTHRIGTTFQTRRLNYTYALGVEFQQAQLQTKNLTVDTSLSRQYINLMPNALFSYTFSRNRSLRLQYRTRLSAPSLTQLQPVVDNTNPLNIRLGNPTLQPEYYNTITLAYNASSSLGARNLFLFASLNQSNNRITTATTVNSAGAQSTQPVNAGGYWSANGVLSVGRLIQPVKLRLTLTTNAVMTKAVSLVNEQTNESRNVSLGQGFRLQSSYNGKIDYGISGNVSYQTVNYSLLPRQNSSFWSQYATVDLHWQLPFNFVLTSDLTYTATSGRSVGYNQQFALLNMALAKQFLKGKQGEIRMQVFDLLNQNRSVSRNATDSYVEDVQSRVLQRYFLVSFVYNLRKFGV